MTPIILIAIVVAFATPALMGLLAIKYSYLFSNGQRKRADKLATQASHRGNPVRIGGLLIMLGCFFSALTVSGYSQGKVILLILLSASPVFIAGFLEDMGIFVKPILRLFAAFLSSAAAIFLTGFLVPKFDIVYLDGIFSFYWASVFVTVVFAGIFCHSLNVADGLNGLAAQIIIYSAIGLAIVGFQIDFKQLAAFCLMITFATISFGYFNWPQARIFLGDAGSYGIGHILVWTGIAYISTDKSIAFSAIILILYWPIAEIVHTVFRRLISGKNIFHPDNKHIHQKTKRLLENILSKRVARRYANPLASLLLIPMVASPPVAGVMLVHRPLYAWVAVLSFFALFTAVYYMLSQREKRLI